MNWRSRWNKMAEIYIYEKKKKKRKEEENNQPPWLFSFLLRRISFYACLLLSSAEGFTDNKEGSSGWLQQWVARKARVLSSYASSEIRHCAPACCRVKLRAFNHFFFLLLLSLPFYLCVCVSFLCLSLPRLLLLLCIRLFIFYSC